MRALRFILPFLGVFLLLSNSLFAAGFWNTSTIYEVFVRSFQDSNGDGIGDLKGITARLDYLNNGESDFVTHPKSLGVKGIWLTPIFDSPTYHGYDATNFYSINADYGTLSDLKELIRQAHARGIKVLLDIAVNHTSDGHPWFLESIHERSLKHDWYVWNKQKPNWGKWFAKNGSYYYSAYGASMPQLNWKNPEVRNEVKQILKFWMQQGVDGFRLDSLRTFVPGPNGEADMPETHEALKDFTTSVREEFPGVLFVGEVWASSEIINTYCAKEKLDLAFGFPLAYSFINSLKYSSPHTIRDGMTDTTTKILESERLAPFLSNHDMVRIATQIDNHNEKLKLAANMLLSMTGTPFIYYGEEIGLFNSHAPGDKGQRSPMQWKKSGTYGFTDAASAWSDFSGEGDKVSVEAQEHSDTSLLNHYRKLIHLRNRTPALSEGNISELKLHEDNRLLTWVRRSSKGSVLIALNVSDGRSNTTVVTLPKQNVLIPALEAYSSLVLDIHSY